MASSEQEEVVVAGSIQLYAGGGQRDDGHMTGARGGAGNAPQGRSRGRAAAPGTSDIDPGRTHAEGAASGAAHVSGIVRR
jgi:hypothetical protein